jgi:hypothetical protein
MTRKRTRLGWEWSREVESLIVSDLVFAADPFAR